MSSERQHVIIWVQHLLGTGHFVRAQRIAMALADLDIDVTLLSGGSSLGTEAPAGVRVVQLPACRSADLDFSGLMDDQGRAVDAGFWDARQRVISDILSSHPPDFLLTEMYPFGRRAFRDEISQMMQTARSAHTTCQFGCSIRDILVTKPEEKSRQMAHTFQDQFDVAYIHSDPSIMPLSVSFPYADMVEEKGAYTGYIAPTAEDVVTLDRPGILVTGGGGRVGVDLHQAAMQVCRKSAYADQPWTFVVGRQFPEGQGRILREEAPQNARIIDHTPHLPAMMKQAKLIISQAGYNSAIEIMQSRVPSVLVPFVHPGEDEQCLRASRMHEIRCSHMLHPDDLDANTLEQAMSDALQTCEPVENVRVDGAHETARLIQARLT